MIIIGCSRGIHLAERTAKKLKSPYSRLIVKKFPDGELYVRFLDQVNGKNVVLVQSFYNNINECIIDTNIIL